MKSVKWIAFSSQDRGTGTVVHFLPATPGAATPYPVELSFTIFGRGIEKKTLAVEGARLFHPDGVKIESLFGIRPSDGDSSYGIEIDVFCSQARSDVSASQCLIEFPLREGPLKFSPTRIILQDAIQKNEEDFIEYKEEKRRSILIKDALLSPSIVIVNSSAKDMRPEVYYSEIKNDEEVLQMIPLGQVAAQSVVERKLDSAFFNDVKPQELSWGLVRSRSIMAVSNSESGVSYSVVFRDTKTSKITSVLSL
ncbi:MAG: hypothetical protein SGJ02_11140 [bacterium]|nr:hypothetical protein [bacterium]